MAKYNHQAARYEEQLLRMKDLESRGVCAFCPENVNVETTSPVELETKYWIVKKNDFPYKGSKHHLLIISKEHVDSLGKLDKASRHEFIDIISQLEKERKLLSYAVGIRSGDMRFNGGSVEHFHAHLVVGENNESSEIVRFKMSSRPENS